MTGLSRPSQPEIDNILRMFVTLYAHADTSGLGIDKYRAHAEYSYQHKAVTNRSIWQG